MTDKRVGISIDGEQTVTGPAREASGGLDRLKQTTQEAGDQAEASGKQQLDLTGAVENFGRQLVAMFGVGSLTAVIGKFHQEWRDEIRATNEELKAQADLTNEQALALRDLQFLRAGFSAADLSIVDRGAVLTGEGRSAIGGAFAELRSKTASLTDAQQVALFEELLETSLTTQNPASTLVPLFAKGSQFVADPNRLQSMLRKMQELSPAASPGVLASKFPQVLNPGVDAGLTPEETGGLLVEALTVSEENGATSLRNILTILAAPDTDARRQILSDRGAGPSIGVLEQLRVLQRGGMSLDDQVALVGRENLSVFGGLLRRNEFDSVIGQINQASLGGTDITEDAIKNIFNEDERLRKAVQTRQVEQQTEGLRSNSRRAQDFALARSIVERELFKAFDQGALTKADVDAKLEMFDSAVAQGMSMEEALNAVVLGRSFTNAARDLAPMATIGVPVIGPFLLGHALFFEDDTQDPGFGPADLPDIVTEELEAGPRRSLSQVRGVQNVTIVNVGNQFNNGDPTTTLSTRPNEE